MVSEQAMMMTKRVRLSQQRPDSCCSFLTDDSGEYIFDHRGGEVEGRTFRDWFINE